MTSFSVKSAFRTASYKSLPRTGFGDAARVSIIACSTRARPTLFFLVTRRAAILAPRSEEQSLKGEFFLSQFGHFGV